jgi:hypothetical protein
VENGVAPDHIVASQNLGGGVSRTRKVCKYPDEATYSGSGSTDSQASFVCTPHDTEPADLAAFTSLAPEVKCKNVTAPASASCSASASVDNGSSNRYGQSIPVVQTPAGPYGLGVTGVTLTGTDSREASSSCQATVTVVDQTPPTITGLSATPPSLWPANHKLVPVQVAASTADNCDAAASCRIVSVSSNEPVTPGDWQITGALTVNLRAERSGSGGDRVYTLGVQCADASGNSAQNTVAVTVPHDQGK